MPMLKEKKRLHYRRGYTHSSCSDCNYYKPYLIDEHGQEVPCPPGEGRCVQFGLEPGRQYRVLGHYICDMYDNSEQLKYLRGW